MSLDTESYSDAPSRMRHNAVLKKVGRISLTEFLSGGLSARFVIKHTRELQSEITRTHSQLLREAICFVIDGRLKFSDTELCLDSIELQYLINYIATF
jgi:hypothetical protein